MNFNSLVYELKNFDPGKILFVGLGNRLRSDDGAGLVLLQEIKKQKEFGKSNFIFAEKNPENYLQQMISYNPQIVIFVDAVNVSESPGAISFLLSEQIESTGISTHAFSIKLIEEYLLNERQIEFRYLCIQPRSTRFHGKVSPIICQRIQEFFLQGL